MRACTHYVINFLCKMLACDFNSLQDKYVLMSLAILCIISVWHAVITILPIHVIRASNATSALATISLDSVSAAGYSASSSSSSSPTPSHSSSSSSATSSSSAPSSSVNSGASPDLRWKRKQHSRESASAREFPGHLTPGKLVFTFQWNVCIVTVRTTCISISFKLKRICSETNIFR